MDAEFVNTYTEVVVENFDAVLKQNLMLQTQLKVLGKKNQNVDELRVRSESVQRENNELKEKLSKFESDLTNYKSLEKTVSEIDVYKKEIVDLRAAIVKYDNELKVASSFKEKAQQFENVVLEKDRIQKALNDTMQQISNLKNDCNLRDEEIANLKDAIKKLEDVPSIVETVKDKKTDKTKNGKSATIETPPKSVKVQSGGFF